MRTRLIVLLLALAGASVVFASAASAGKPEIDPTYANGKTVNMIGPHLIVDGRDKQPNLCAHSEELYLAVQPVFHPGLPAHSSITTTSSRVHRGWV